MKKSISIALTVFGLSGAFASDPGINFREKSFSDAIKLAKQENKLVFVDFYASWCGPCKWMDKYVFNSADVGELMNDKFISLKVNVEESEYELVTELNIESIPTYGFFNTNGELLLREEGSMESSEFLRLAKLAASAKKYSSVNIDLSQEESPDLVLSIVAAEDPDKAMKLAEDYVSQMLNDDPNLEKSTYADWNIIDKYIAPSSTYDGWSQFQLSDINKKLLENAIGILEYNAISDIAKSYYDNTIDLILENAKEGELDETMELINPAFEAYWAATYEVQYPSERHNDYNEIRYWLANNQKEKYLSAIPNWLSSFHEDDAFFHRLMGILVYEVCEEPICLENAEKNLIKSTELEDNGENNLVLGLFYSNTGQTEKLKPIITKAKREFTSYENYYMFEQLEGS